MKNKVIKSTRIVTPEGIISGAVLIKNGKIEAVLPGEYTEMENVEDVGNWLILPGFIDPHVHINEPGRTAWEGFDTATRAAIAGGITTLVDMPLNASPVTTNLDAFNKKINSTEGKLHTNCGFWGGIIPGNTDQIIPLAKAGVLGFKAFLTHSGIDEFPNVTEEDLRIAMPVIASRGLPLLVHCELTDDEPRATGDLRSYANYLSSRPKFWEDDAIKLMIGLCEKYNCIVHIVHLSSADSIQQVKEAKNKNLPLTVETGQHYLYFNAEAIGDGQTQFKSAPPIREKSNNEELWKALADSTIDFVATDHSPATPDLKEIDSGNFMKAWGGIASVQFAFPVLWTAARARGFSIENITTWLSENPAKLIGKENTKGKIANGYDADIIIVDEEKSFVVNSEMILHKHKVTPYLGERLYGVVEQTYLGGEKVYEHGKFIKLNSGKIILR